METHPDLYIYKKENTNRELKAEEEKFNRIKKMQELISKAVSSISRVAHQLREGGNIDKSNALKKLSVCGLRLEHMLATLYKKKMTFVNDSINTDFAANNPPNFMGIDNRCFV